MVKRFTAQGLTKKEKKDLEKQGSRILKSKEFKALTNAGFTRRKAFKIIRGF